MGSLDLIGPDGTQVSEEKRSVDYNNSDETLPASYFFIITR